MIGSASARGDGRRYFDPRGNEVPYDGASPVGWYLSASVLVIRDGKVLMVCQPPQWGGRWELPGGGAEPGESLLQAATRECYEETGYRFITSSPAPIHVEEDWLHSSRGTYLHAVNFIFRGDVGEVDSAWSQDHVEIVQVAWIDPRELAQATTRSIHWRALHRTGVV